MEYPMANNCLVFKQNPDNTYTIKNYLNDEETTVGSGVVDFLRQLDGYTHPYDIDPSLEPDFVDELLDSFREVGFIRESLFYKESAGTYLYALYIPKNRTNKMRPARIICFFVSWLILLSWAPLLGLGIYSFVNGQLSSDYLMFGMVLGTIVGAFLHEISHAISACAYGGRIFEIGVMLSHFVMPGAYVLMDQTPVKRKLRRAQINAAGIEMNLLLAGAFFCFASTNYQYSGLLFGCALANVFLGLLNMTVAFGLDGEHVMGNLIGDDNFAGKSIITVLGKNERSLLKKKGINGQALIVASYIMGLSQVSLLVIIIANVIGVISWLK